MKNNQQKINFISVSYQAKWSVGHYCRVEQFITPHHPQKKIDNMVGRFNITNTCTFTVQPQLTSILSYFIQYLTWCVFSWLWHFLFNGTQQVWLSFPSPPSAQLRPFFIFTSFFDGIGQNNPTRDTFSYVKYFFKCCLTTHKNELQIECLLYACKVCFPAKELPVIYTTFSFTPCFQGILYFYNLIG